MSLSTRAQTRSYSTSFDLTESPISESNVWRHNGLDWTVVETGNGNAYGTQAGTGAFNDSYAYLSGFPADQGASGVIHRAANISGTCTREVELLLRWSDAAHSAKGYECNVAFDGSYAEIVRWNGEIGSFTYLAKGSVPGGVRDGDKVSAAIVGQTITLSVNGKEVARATDATFSTGNPGIGFWRGGPCGTRGDYGFTSFSATSAVSAASAPARIGKGGFALLGAFAVGWFAFARRKKLQAALA